jgi:hypothetical protein
MLNEVVDFIDVFQILPDMFQHMAAIFRGVVGA